MSPTNLAVTTRRYVTSDKFWTWYLGGISLVGFFVVPLGASAYRLVLLVVTVPLLSWCTFFADDYRRIRRWRKADSSPARYLSVNHEWQFESNGDFTGTGIYELENTSTEPMFTLPRDDFLWAVNPRTARIRVRVLDDGGIRHAITEYDNSVYRRALSALSNRDQTQYVVSFSHTIAPALQPGESMRFELLMETPGTEVGAFTESGTVLGIPANIPTLMANLMCVAPAGYAFEIMTPRWVVESSTGENVPDEEQRICDPVLSPAATTLNWRLSDLKVGLRYWVQYRFREKAIPETPLEHLDQAPVSDTGPE